MTRQTLSAASITREACWTWQVAMSTRLARPERGSHDHHTPARWKRYWRDHWTGPSGRYIRLGQHGTRSPPLISLMRLSARNGRCRNWSYPRPVLFGSSEIQRASRIGLRGGSFNGSTLPVISVERNDPQNSYRDHENAATDRESARAGPPSLRSAVTRIPFRPLEREKRRGTTADSQSRCLQRKVGHSASKELG